MGIVVPSVARYQCLGRSIVKVLCFLADTVMALILETTLDAPKTRAFVTLNDQLKSSQRLHHSTAHQTHHTSSELADKQSKHGAPSYAWVEMDP